MLSNCRQSRDPRPALPNRPDQGANLTSYHVPENPSCSPARRTGAALRYPDIHNSNDECFLLHFSKIPLPARAMPGLTHKMCPKYTKCEYKINYLAPGRKVGTGTLKNIQELKPELENHEIFV